MDNDYRRSGQEFPEIYDSASENMRWNESDPPVYDDFMYEPLGFEELERHEREAYAAKIRKKRKKNRLQRLITSLLIFLIIASGAMAALQIFTIYARTRTAANKKNGSVVIYRNSKPEGANDLSNFKDESGRYTIEGAAAAVIDSIVEIFVYGDTAHEHLLGTGSGIVLTEDGYIVTNTHVLEADGYHTVATSDGKTYDAKIIGRDVKTDIAVIKISGAKLTPAVLGNSDETIVGEQVIAVGNPAGLSGTVTDGIVSHIGRRIRSDSTGFQMECIQTNAQISPGNSGGALVNMYGQVIGITSSKYVSSSFEGLGFAITINEALPIIEELINNGYISGRFRVGIEFIDMSTEESIAAIEEELNMELPEDFKGIYINSISEDADIANSELVPGDFITEINGKSISTYDDLHNTISSMYSAGDTVPARCAHISEDGEITCYDIEFKLMEDTSGDY